MDSPSATPYLETRGSWKRSQISPTNYDYSFKILVIGDSGVGKSSLLLSFISTSGEQHVSPTIGVDFKMKMLTVEGKRLKLTIWDTAGQERFGTLTSSYYRGAHGIILVYDVTRRETFTNLSEIWAREVDLYSTNPDCVKILVGNKVDRDVEQAVTVEEGMEIAKKHDCLFYECSARTRANVQQCFKDLSVKVRVYFVLDYQWARYHLKSYNHFLKKIIRPYAWVTRIPP
ncbi:Ras-related protein RabC2a-like protein [Tanacetum coccineum]